MGRGLICSGWLVVLDVAGGFKLMLNVFALLGDFTLTDGFVVKAYCVCLICIISVCLWVPGGGLV